jgi:hypothetical protein
VGVSEGLGEGGCVGAEDGDGLGAGVGLAEGAGVGAAVGEGVQASVLHGASSFVVARHGPATPIGLEETARDRAEVPPPQAAEQAPHAAQSLTTQSVQDNDEHVVVMARAGQARPPKRAASIRGRTRCELPDAHFSLQVDHAPQLPIVQSTGQEATSEHPTSSLVGVHTTPPVEAGDVTARVRPAVP